eukprot:168135_1
MCTNQESIQWILLNSCPSDFQAFPTGMNANNYFIIDTNDPRSKINCIYKYNIDNDKWIKINDFNTMENMSPFSAALDVKKQILFLSSKDCVTEIQLNNNNINTHTHS